MIAIAIRFVVVVVVVVVFFFDSLMTPFRSVEILKLKFNPEH